MDPRMLQQSGIGMMGGIGGVGAPQMPLPMGGPPPKGKPAAKKAAPKSKPKAAAKSKSKGKKR